MKMSTKGKYAIKAMYDLAVEYENEPQSITLISIKRDIPKQYLEQLMKKLRQENLVISVRGPKGGYTLAKSPKEITIGQIIRAVEEPTKPVDCPGKEFCNEFDGCVTKILWEKIAVSISDVIDNETLQDMLEY